MLLCRQTRKRKLASGGSRHRTPKWQKRSVNFGLVRMRPESQPSITLVNNQPSVVYTKWDLNISFSLCVCVCVPVTSLANDRNLGSYLITTAQNIRSSIPRLSTVDVALCLWRSCIATVVTVGVTMIRIAMLIVPRPCIAASLIAASVEM